MTVGENKEQFSEPNQENEYGFLDGQGVEEEDYYEPQESDIKKDVIEQDEEITGARSKKQQSSFSIDTFKKKESSSSIDSIEGALLSIKNAELRGNYIKYMKILSDIKAKNEEVKQVKEVIKSRYCKANRTFADNQEIGNLKFQFEKQYKKLKRLLNKAVRLQSKDPLRKWNQIEIETTPEEDLMCGQFRYK